MEPPIVIRFRWTADELLRAHDYHSRHTSLPSFRIFMHFCFTVLLLAGIFDLISGKDEYRTLAIIFVVLGVYWFVLRRFERRLMARFRLAQRPDKDAENEWHVTPEQIEERDGLTHSQFSWQAFPRIVRTPAGVIAYRSTSIFYPGFYWLPRHGFASDAEFERFIELAKTKIPRFAEVADAAADWAHPLVRGLLAFPVCWFLALLVHLALVLYRSIAIGFDGFHGVLGLLIVTIFGSLAGMIGYLVAVPILLLRRRARAVSPLSQKHHPMSQ